MISKLFLLCKVHSQRFQTNVCDNFFNLCYLYIIYILEASVLDFTDAPKLIPCKHYSQCSIFTSFILCFHVWISNDFRHLLPDPDRYLISIYNHIWLMCFCFILILNVAWLFDSYFCWFIFFKYKHSCTKTRVLMIYFVYAQYKQHALKIHVKWYSEMFITITTIYWRESQ